jgi:hypothetical protein
MQKELRDVESALLAGAHKRREERHMRTRSMGSRSELIKTQRL